MGHLRAILLWWFQLSWQCLETPSKGTTEHAGEEGDPLKDRQHYFRGQGPVLKKMRKGTKSSSLLLLPYCRCRVVDSSPCHYGFSNRLGWILQMWAKISPSPFKLLLPGLFYHSRTKVNECNYCLAHEIRWRDSWGKCKLGTEDV